MSVDWHVWPRCNYACTFCFATFPGVERALPRADAVRLLSLLRDAGTRKLSFAGGEPTLCPHLPELLRAAKEAGMTTMIVTNATRLSPAYLRLVAPVTDWIAISVDSISNAVEEALGRGHGNHVDLVRQAARRVQAEGIRLKLNTVVTALTWEEDMHALIRDLRPARWKVFQALPIIGENDGFLHWVSADQFRAFLDRHADLEPVGEDNEAMTESYVMLDPLGRFFQNTDGIYVYSPSVLEVGVSVALEHAGWNRDRFIARGGLYDWDPGRDPAERHGQWTIPSLRGPSGSLREPFDDLSESHGDRAVNPRETD